MPYSLHDMQTLLGTAQSPALVSNLKLIHTKILFGNASGFQAHEVDLPTRKPHITINRNSYIFVDLSRLNSKYLSFVLLQGASWYAGLDIVALKRLLDKGSTCN